MLALDGQAREFREQVSLVASREADLKDRIAKLRQMRRTSDTRQSVSSLMAGHEGAFRFAKPPF